MKRLIIITFAVAIAIGTRITASSNSAKETFVPLGIERAPEVALLQAIQIARARLKEKKVDTSKHYMDNVRLLHDSTWMKGKHWIVVWERRGPRPVMGGPIFVFVDMDKNVRVQGGI